MLPTVGVSHLLTRENDDYISRQNHPSNVAVRARRRRADKSYVPFP
jgi:hypothetical protein